MNKGAFAGVPVKVADGPRSLPQGHYQISQIRHGFGNNPDRRATIMHLIRTSILLGLLSTAACDEQTYRGEYTPYNVRSYAVQPYAVQPTMPGYPTYQEPGYAVLNDVTPLAYDDRWIPRGGNYYGDFGRGYGRREWEERREQDERREFRQDQRLQRRETQQRQELYNSHVRDLQTQHNQGVVNLQQQFNQGRINRDQLNNGYHQLEQHMNGGIANEQRALPR